jgi:hypothetical protein
MIESTDRNRFAPQQPMPFPRPQFDMGMDKFQQPTQVAPPMEAPAAPQMRSVLKRDGGGAGAEENIRKLIEQMKGYQKPGFTPNPMPSY